MTNPFFKMTSNVTYSGEFPPPWTPSLDVQSYPLPYEIALFSILDYTEQATCQPLHLVGSPYGNLLEDSTACWLFLSLPGRLRRILAPYLTFSYWWIKESRPSFLTKQFAFLLYTNVDISTLCLLNLILVVCLPLFLPYHKLLSERK